MTKKLVPPDGGWGWIIVAAYACSLICTVSIVQSFGLLFKDICTSLGMSATDISVIISVNSAFGMGLGLVNGPLLRYFGYRKIAIAGTIFHTTGLLLSSIANSFAQLIITYGIVCSLGFGIMNAAFSLALNSYFTRKRGRAVGFAMALSGLGPILFPQLIIFLMSYYGGRGTITILGAISLHTLAGALTLQPISWHQKKSDDQEVKPNEISNIPNENSKVDKESLTISCEDLGALNRKRTMTMSSIDHDVNTGSIYGFETLTPRKKSTSQIYGPVDLGPAKTEAKTYRRSSSQYDPAQVPSTPTSYHEPAYKWWSSGKSLDTINLGSSMKIFEDARTYRASRSRDYSIENDQEGDRRPSEIQSLVLKQIVQTVKEEEDDVDELDKEAQYKQENKNKDDNDEKMKKEEKKKSVLLRALHSIVVFFDFDLLSDPSYVSIMLGMSIAMFAELNFSILTPFILSEMELDTEQIATVMSSLAIADLSCRGIAPFVGEWLNQTAKNMYLISLVLLVSGRSALLFVQSFKSILIVGIALGIAKGVRSVFMTLVIANYVPIEKLASASGLQMVTNALMFIIVGPLLGVMKDKSGSYDYCIIFINGCTIFTIVAWTLEIMIKKLMGKPTGSFENRYQKRRSRAQETSDEVN